MDWTNSSQWNNRGDRQKISDSVEMLPLANSWTTVRMVGKAVTIALHWLNTKPGKPKEGQKPKTKPNSFPKPCHGTFIADDGSTQIDATKCPYCKELEHYPRLEAFQNVISRKLQEDEPRKKGKPTRYERKKRKLLAGVAFYKEDKESEAWTPVRMVRVTSSLGKKISEIASLNTRKGADGVKKAYGPDHSKYGFDLMLKYDENAASPNDMYSAQKGERTSLSEEELEYLRWSISTEIKETLAEAQKEAKRIKPYLCDRQGNLTFPELAEEGKKKGKKDSHGKYRDQFDEDEDDEDDEDEDDDDDDRRSKKSKSKKSKKSKGKSKRRDDDENDESDDDDDQFDEGTDDDDDDDDDEDDRRSRKSSKKSKSKKRSRDEDDEDESDEDDEDEDDDDDRRSRIRKAKLAKAKAKLKSKGKKRRRDDDDDEIPF